jgi:hypothetical protein
MSAPHSLEDLLDFLTHAGDRGLMPAATAQALAVATRNVFAVLDDAERAALPLDELDAVITRFNNKRARDFNPGSLREYARRVRRAVELFQNWKRDPANFSVKTRTTTPTKRSGRTGGRSTADAPAPRAPDTLDQPLPTAPASAVQASGNAYQTAFPVRPGHVVTVSNIPLDLSASEAERLAQFVRLLAPTLGL